MPVSSDSDHSVAQPIQCILSDVDGVMTDGRIIYDSAGAETKQFHVRDGLGIKLWMQAGFPFGIITARNSPMVERRAVELGISHVSQGSGDKLQRALEILPEWGCELSSVCYIGDDLPDVPVMRRVGLAVAPADAAADVRNVAHWVLSSSGGHGAVRETIERLLRAKSLWSAAEASA
ncbi:3-deoxy-D-manno-octulosonate 8-phosphate phosphatase KdsC [Stieleria neptunia]|uniref:3-deoxy-D-manno-octulosonate 8-phosphate phosphatase KdsC n=1 Tax=Stieleria neptunia TaxID=2527979 RepID=A0A518HVR7_9BACT|nr:HAD hydrolase family protein [Stieleria neptunia]QDV44938.1 3-deoxy-D-manno-octulosonate 8-phosphate phosphatase KdsC [Stieleria neptunia]